MGNSEYILNCEGISKAFGGTQALKDVQLHVKPGEVHALLGENGAGKSTLMKCVIGLIKQDAGTMEFEGKPYQAKGPVDALNSGISMIHQELNPEPHLTVAESIFLKRENTKGIFLDKKAQNKRCQEILDQFNVPYTATTKMKELTLAQVQMVEIIKAVSCDSRLIIMDEPTSSLDSTETDRLFNVIRDLKKKGVAIIYISHRMEEIFEICDSVSVFRNGTYVNTRSLDGVTRDELISMMVGRDVKSVFPKVDCKIGDVVFKVENLCGKGFHNISFEVHAGEILGISGLVGSGRSETMRAIFGLDPLESGKMYLDGKEIKNKNPRDAIKKGICMVNEDRKNYGLCLLRSIRENISLPNLPEKQKGLLLKWTKAADVPCDWDASKAVNTVDDYLAQYGDDLKAVICDNDDMSSAAQAECNAKGRSDIVCIGVDGNQGPLQMIKDGELGATVLQDAPGQVNAGIDAIVAAIKGETVEKNYTVPFVLVTSENVDDYLAK